MNDIFNWFLGAFDPHNEIEIQSTIGCFGCGKSRQDNNNIKRRRIRAASQSRLKNGEYFNITHLDLRSKSKEHQHITPHVRMIRAKSSSGYRNENGTSHKENSGNKNTKQKNSQDIITENTSKVQSKMQTETKDSYKNNNSGKSSRIQNKSRNSKNLIIVKEETEQNMKSDSNLPEVIDLYKKTREENKHTTEEIKQLVNEDYYDNAKLSSINSKALKNNYLINSGPIGSWHKLDMKDEVKYCMTKQIENDDSRSAYNKKGSIGINTIAYSNKEDNSSNYFVNKCKYVVDKPPMTKMRSYFSKSGPTLRSNKYKSLEKDNRDIQIQQVYGAIENDKNYEIKANGMMKVRWKKMKNGENAYMSKRLKSQPALNFSSSSLRYKKSTQLDMLHENERHLPEVKGTIGAPKMVIK